MFELPAPDEKTREQIFEIHTGNKKLEESVSLKKLARDTEDMVGADIEFICRKASMIAIREIIEDLKGLEEDSELKILIKEKHFDEVIQLVKKQNSIKK